MSAPKVGDRVRVEFEGTVESSDAGSGIQWVNGNVEDGTSFTVPLYACTVLAPPVKVGDLVTKDNIGQLPLSSVVAFRHGGPVLERWSNVGVGSDWRSTSGLAIGSDGAVGATVLRVGGAS